MTMPKWRKLDPRRYPTGAAYVASTHKRAEVFHLPDCRHVERMNQRLRRDYVSRRGALVEGLRPCAHCQP